MEEGKMIPSGSVGAAHKSNGFAVSDGNESQIWFVAVLTHQKYTKAFCDFIAKYSQESPLQYYVPSKRELHVYPNRTKRVVETFVIPRVVFVTGMTEREAYYRLVPACSYLDFFMGDRASNRVDGHTALAKVNNRDMKRLQSAIDDVTSADELEFTTDNLKFDQQIQVVNGQLSGLTGGYYQDSKHDYLVLTVGNLGNIKIKVQIKNCQLSKGKKLDSE